MKTLTATIAAALLATVALAQVPVPMSPCVIHTPQEALKQGKTYEITYEGCTGSAPIYLRHGDPSNLDRDEKPACASTDLAAGSCRFTPQKGSNDMLYTFSTTDQSGIESFSGEFKITPKKVTNSSKTKTKGKQPKASAQKKNPQAQVMRRKRSLYDIHSFGML
ncbi:hypothetical protein BGZ73_001890 [Actinomortierella ambigua]|nr:hypothetical protein BGZ73_001890 [Actinomortierella ambigua]